MIRSPAELLFNRFRNLNVYYILIVEGFNFFSVPYLKCFGISQLKFEIVELYKNKVKFT